MTRLELTDHPIVIAAAEGMARESVDNTGACAAPGQLMLTWAALNPDEQLRVRAECARILCDTSRAASRDWWVRWLADYDCASYDAQWASENANIDAAGKAYLERMWPTIRASDHAGIRGKCGAIRDDAEALAAAVMAAIGGAS